MTDIRRETLHDRVETGLSAADDRLRLSEWLPPQEGVVPRVRIGRRWVNVLAGHGRVEAARERGMSTVPCLCVGHLSAAEKRAYVLAYNKLALNAGWDEELLGLELKELMESDIEFDVGLTGFSIAEVDQLVEGLAHEDVGDPADDRLPDPSRVAARCRPGDMWRLGSHRLICGDALDPLVIAALMDDDKRRSVREAPFAPAQPV